MAVLTEAGFRCAVPTCRTILAIDLHHIEEVAKGGSDDPSNLLALCPTCHALYHRGEIPREAIVAYKSILVSLSHAFDVDAIDKLQFLAYMPKDFLLVSGDGVLSYARLIAAGLVGVALGGNNNNLIVTYKLNLTPKGRMLVSAWWSGDRQQIEQAMASPLNQQVSSGNSTATETVAAPAWANSVEATPLPRVDPPGES